MKRSVSLFIIFMLGLFLLAVPIALAQESPEIEGPPHPSIDLWTGCCENHTLPFDSATRDERSRGTRTDRDELEEDVIERIVREVDSVCIAAPWPGGIDDYYVGCVVRFQPEPAYVDVWE